MFGPTALGFNFSRDGKLAKESRKEEQRARESQVALKNIVVWQSKTDYEEARHIYTYIHYCIYKHLELMVERPRARRAVRRLRRRSDMTLYRRFCSVAASLSIAAWFLSLVPR